MEEDGIWGSETHSKDNENTLMRTLPILRISLQSSTKERERKKRGVRCIMGKSTLYQKNNGVVILSTDL